MTKRITWRVEQKRALHPFVHIVERIKPPATRRVADTRTLTQRWQGDPLPGRSALDMRR